MRLALPREIFEPASSRLLWLAVHVALVIGGFLWTWFALGEGYPLWVLVPVTIVHGLSFAGLAFVAHEALHGALTHSKFMRRFAGQLGFLPFWVSPRLWISWHNRVHHGNTNIAGRDPDAYPTLSEYETSRAARWAVLLGAPRSGKLRGLITLALGFTLQSLQILVGAKKRRFLSNKHYVRAWCETALAMLVWTALGLWVGWVGFLFAYVVPLMIANAIVMAHIATNHSLSPLADENDALETSLTVSVPKWFEFYSLGFGYHVEHHLFPAMSNRHAPLVQSHLRRVAPDRYQEMPLFRALVRLWQTPRVYRDQTTLLDPETGQTASTIGSRAQVLAPLFAETPDSPPSAPTDSSGATSQPWEILAGTGPIPSPRISSIPPPPAA